MVMLALMAGLLLHMWPDTGEAQPVFAALAVSSLRA